MLIQAGVLALIIYKGENMYLSYKKIIIIINQSKNQEHYTLMHKDIPLAEIDDTTAEFTLYPEHKQFLPYALRKPRPSYRDFERWAEKRSLILDRKNSKALLNSCGLPQDDRFEVAKACKLLSIEDCFWVKESEDEKWDDINLRNNSLSKEITQIALNGEYIAITGEIITPEFAVAGYSPKAWVKETDGLYLYKKSHGNFESQKEVLASDILDVLNIPHIAYQMTSTDICKCKCMTDENYSRLTFGEYKRYCENNQIDPYEIFNTKYNQYFCQMAVVDYILANTDRHAENWGFFVDNNTGQISAPHPLFDHNLAFDHKFQDSTTYIPASDYTNYELALEAASEYEFDFEALKKIPEDRFIELGIDYQSVLNRIRNVQRH